MQSHSDVISAFGGVRPLCEAINVKPKLAVHWPHRGIPAKFWPAVEIAAHERERPIPITAAMLMKMPAKGEVSA
jgi:hypothetical protein